jgi:hypothetical protein
LFECADDFVERHLQHCFRRRLFEEGDFALDELCQRKVEVFFLLRW